MLFLAAMRCRAEVLDWKLRVQEEVVLISIDRRGKEQLAMVRSLLDPSYLDWMKRLPSVLYRLASSDHRSMERLKLVCYFLMSSDRCSTELLLFVLYRLVSSDD